MLAALPQMNCFCQIDSSLRAQQLADSGKFESAISILLKSLPDHQKEPLELANAYMLLAKCHSYMGLLEYGLNYYELAYETSQTYQLQEVSGKSLLGIGSVYFAMDSVNQALTYFEKSLPILQELRDSLNLAYIYSNLGLFYSDLGYFEKSQSSFNQALIYFESLTDYHGIASTYYNMSINESRSKHQSKAIELLKESLKTSTQYQLTEDAAKAVRRLALVHLEAQDYFLAAQYFYSYDTIGHDIHHQDSREDILELETAYKTARLERDTAKKQARIQLLYFILGFIAIISILGYFILDQRRRRIRITSDQKINNLLQQQEVKTAYALLEGQDKERKRIASELHDNLGSILTSLNMFSDALVTKKDTKQIEEIANKISETSHLANEEVRKISHSLDSGLLNHFGLKTAITQLMEAVEASKNIKVELELQIEDHLANETGLEIYRMIQELVNNTLKHASCSMIRLDISHINHEMSIIYHDNGVGFIPSNVKRGMGLNNIGKRITRLGGGLSIESEPEKGSTFIIELPQI